MVCNSKPNWPKPARRSSFSKQLWRRLMAAPSHASASMNCGTSRPLFEYSRWAALAWTGTRSLISSTPCPWRANIGVLISARERFPRLAQKGLQLADLRSLARRWSNAFLPDGSLTDDASVALRRIRRDIEKQKRGIQDSLERFMRAHRQDGTLQEDFVAIREDRYVVPIVAGQKGRVDGVIHGSSGTGRTLYVEPLETISLN